MRGDSGWAILLVLAHLVGSLVLTGVGVLIGTRSRGSLTGLGSDTTTAG